MITNPSDSFKMLKNFFENNLTTLDLSDLIYIDSPLRDGASTMNIKPISISNSKLESINLENLTNQLYRLNGENLTSLSLPQLSIIYDTTPNVNTAFSNIGNLTSSSYRQGFLTYTKLRELVLSNFLGTPTNLIPTQGMSSEVNYMSFFGNYWLEDITFGNEFIKDPDGIYSFNGDWFYNNYSIKALHLKYNYVIPLVNTTGLQFSSLRRSGGSGKIYVPDDLVDSYKKANNWRSFDSNIEKESNYSPESFQDSIKDSWATILNSPAAAYKIGDTKTFFTNNIPIQMKIVAKSDSAENISDFLASGEGRATFTWAPTTISYFTPVTLNNVYSEGERSYNTEEILKSALATIYNGMDATLRNGIKEVIKYSRGYDRTGNASMLSYVGKIWPFSRSEFGIEPASGNTLLYNTLGLREYYLGATYFTEYNNTPIAIPLRDITNAAGDLDILQWDTSVSTLTMQPRSGVTSALVFPFFGFCT